MEDREKPSLLNRVLTPIIFLVGGLCASFWFIYRAYILFQSRGDIVLLDKGSFYMLGVGLGMLALAFIVIWESWLLKPVGEKVRKAFSRLAIVSLVLLFALPHAIHYAADYRLKAKGYSICEAASHQWLFIRDIAYIKSSIECSAELKNKITK